ncbi:MAG TPA: PrsW family glutamic-type intramembrane protease [Acidobacteriota bacterium]
MAAAVGLLPVLVFLLALISLDSYKLVPLGRVLLLLAAGVAAAGLALLVNRALAGALTLDPKTLVRYVAPLVEETIKGAVVVVLIARRRVGFLVDAAIAGFAVGAGFAAAENLHTMLVLPDARPALWLVRGFGTAIMHGGVTASLAIGAKTFADRRRGGLAPVFLPGWLLAVAVHSSFNHFFVGPDLQTLAVLVVLPVLFFLVFRVSEGRTRAWLGTGFDTDAELLELVHSGRVSTTPIGAYLASVREHFSPTTVADMICLLRLRLELSLRAKGILILRQAGAVPRPDPEIEEKFTELRFLESSIGPTGLAALRPIFNFSDQDLWQFHMLAGSSGPKSAARRRASGS